jgi:Flp pilus assembly protein CpaB
VSQRRTLILIAAIAIGALASFLVWNYVGNIQDQAYSDAERVKVYLVKEEIPRGTSGNVATASIVEESIPRKFKPANAIVSLDDIAGKVARADLVANQVVVADMFVDAGDPEAQVSFADNLEKIQNTDQTTFTMSLDEVRGVAGLIVPGDYVNILVMKFAEVQAGGGGGEATEGQEGNPAIVSDFQARYLYQKVQVLAVDYLTVGDSNAAAAGGSEPAAAAPADVQKGMITLIVPAAATQILASIPPENIYLSLVGKDYEPVPSGEIDIAPLPSDDPSRITPYGPEGARSSD